MSFFSINADTFNPRVYYLSLEYYDSDNFLPSHIHTFPTIMFVKKLQGVCIYKIGACSYSVKQGDVILINPGVYHHKQLEAGSCIHEIHLAFDRIHLVGYPENHVVYPYTHAVVSLKNADREEFNNCFESFLQEQAHTKPFSELYAKALLMQLFVLSMRQLFTENSDTAEDNQPFRYMRSTHEGIVSDLREYLIEHYADDISLSVVASQMYISPEYLSRIFKNEIGKSPMTFLIEIRLNKAKEMLEDKHLSVANIAKSVGYTDVYHFSKLFKKYFSLSPMHYRKMLGEVHSTELP